jgi:hypothetical protein
MRRVQLIELHEQAWFPQSIRDEITDMLEFGLNLSNAYASAAPLLQQAIHSTRSHYVIDLCSGGGGPWVGLSRKLQENARALQICLTDKYPNLKAYEKTEAMSGDITFHPESVDATNVPPELRGFRTMFTTSHHFPREEALAILRSSVGAGIEFVREGLGFRPLVPTATENVSAKGFLCPCNSSLLEEATVKVISPLKFPRTSLCSLEWPYPRQHKQSPIFVRAFS